MTFCKKKPIIFMFSAKDRNWNDSTESIQKQKMTKLTKSDTSMKVDQVNFLLLQSEALNSERIIRTTGLEPQHQLLQHPLKSDTETRTESTLSVYPKDSTSGEIAVLKVTLSRPESRIYLTESEDAIADEKALVPFDIVSVIDGSEDAPKDKLPWKYLRRCRVYEKEKGRLITWLRSIHYHYSKFLGRRRVVTSCPNCTFSVKTIIKHVSTVRTRRSACTLTVVGLCGLPYVTLLFKDVVHVCPFCNVYLGFCPAFKYPKKSESVASEFMNLGAMGDARNEELKAIECGMENAGWKTKRKHRQKSKF